MKKNNLIELCLSPDLGGLELYMVRCAKSLSESFDVLSVIAKQTKLMQYYEDDKHRFTQIKRAGSFSISAARKLAKIIDENDTQIVHLHWTKDIPIAVMAKVFSKKKPKLVQTRNMTMTRFKNDFYHRFLYKNIDLMLPVTHAVASQINKFIPQDIRPKVEVLYMGSDRVELLSDDEIGEYKKTLNVGSSFMVGLVGRINEFKGQYLLIDAMEKLVEKGLDIQAYIVGHAMDEEYLLKLKESVKAKNLENNFHFLGFEKNPHRFMQACDSVIMASKCETFGLVSIEAMQVQTVIIGANSCGVLEIIDDKESGVLFENQNASDLAEKIELLYHDEELKNKIAKAGRLKAEDKFSNVKQFDKLDKILKDLVL
jgi:glycosyltransferase involved in cell wall biosynthesis